MGFETFLGVLWCTLFGYAFGAAFTLPGFGPSYQIRRSLVLLLRTPREQNDERLGDDAEGEKSDHSQGCPGGCGKNRIERDYKGFRGHLRYLLTCLACCSFWSGTAAGVCSMVWASPDPRYLASGFLSYALAQTMRKFGRQITN